MRERIIAANWKMNKTSKQTYDYFREFGKELKSMKMPKAMQKRIVIAAPYTSLPAASKAVVGMRIFLAAQDMHYADKGAFTGEISPVMLIEHGVSFVILGHSERRQGLGEKDELINKKVLAALNAGMAPILCIGETLKERKKGMSQKIVRKQLLLCLKDVPHQAVPKVIIAYEPVWAISTTKDRQDARPKDIAKMHEVIRIILDKEYNKFVAKQALILYGGSVSRDNIKWLKKVKGVDGYLVGGASLDPKHFAKIVRFG